MFPYIDLDSKIFMYIYYMYMYLYLPNIFWNYKTGQATWSEYCTFIFLETHWSHNNVILKHFKGFISFLTQNPRISPMVAKKIFFKNPILLIDFFHSQNIWKRQSGRQVMKIAFFHLNCCSTREYSISGLNLQGFLAVLTSRFGG